MSNILAEKYVITKHLSSTSKINYYIGSARSEQVLGELLINEVLDRDFINEYLDEFLEMFTKDKVSEFIDCFSENSKLYLVFPYYSGQGLLKYIDNNKLNAYYKKVLIYNVLHNFLNCYKYPLVMRRSILEPSNIIVSNNDFYFNYLLSVPNSRSVSEKEIYSGVRGLFESCFTEKEISSDIKLSIIMEKCEKGVYASVSETMKDLVDALNATEEEITMALLADRKKKLKKTVANSVIAVSLISLLVSIFALYRIYRTEIKFNGDVVETIGTLTLNKREETDKVNIVNIEALGDIVTPEPNPSPRPTPSPAPTPSPGGSSFKEDYIYKIIYRDTLSHISLKFYKSLKYINPLAKYNNISNVDLIYTDTTMKIPEKGKLDSLYPTGK